MELEDVFALENKKEINRILLQEEVNAVVVVDWREEEEDIVRDFADTIGEDLTGDLTDENDLIISYNGKQVNAGLKSDMGDRYRALRALRNIMSDKYEIRIVTESLLGDTHLFVVKTKEWWQDFNTNYGTIAAEVFTTFTDDIEF